MFLLSPKLHYVKLERYTGRRKGKEIVLHHLDFLPSRVLTADNNVIRRAGTGKRWNAFWGELAANAVVGSD